MEHETKDLEEQSKRKKERERDMEEETKDLEKQSTREREREREREKFEVKVCKNQY